MQKLKKNDVRKRRSSPINAENNRGVTNDVTFAYVHEKINVPLSVFSIFAFFYMILTCTHKVLYTYNLLSINWASKRASFREMQRMHICYTVVLYTAMSRLSSYI